MTILMLICHKRTYNHRKHNWYDTKSSNISESRNSGTNACFHRKIATECLKWFKISNNIFKLLLSSFTLLDTIEPRSFQKKKFFRANFDTSKIIIQQTPEETNTFVEHYIHYIRILLHTCISTITKQNVQKYNLSTPYINEKPVPFPRN